MGPAFIAFSWVTVIGLQFVPVFIVALVMLRSLKRALVLSATFTAGAFAGFVGFGFLGGWLIERRMTDSGSTTLVIAFATAGAVGVGVLAVYFLGKSVSYPPWRR
jgi:hypothetical protein